MPALLRQSATVLLVLCGTALCLLTTPGRANVGWQLVAAGLALAVGLIPAVWRRVGPLLDRLGQPSPRARAITAVVVGLLGGLYLLAAATVQGRDLEPKWHDEQMFLVQARIMATGRLWMPRHEVAGAFETFHVFVEPVYAAMHFPGTPLLYVPAVWLELPAWVLPLAAAAGVVGLLYRVTAELIDGAAGLLAALLLLGVSQFRFLGLTVMSQVPAMLFGLLTAWAYLRWRRHQGLAWGVAIGAFAGWAAIVRPVEALCYAAPVGLAVLMDLRRRPTDGGAKRRRWLATPALIVAGAAPFLALQLAFDRGVTGHWLKTPHQLYTERFHPGATFGVAAAGGAARPATTLRQKLDYYDQFVVPEVRAGTELGPVGLWTEGGRFLYLWNGALPANVLVALLPAGLLAAGGRRWVVAGFLAPFVACYSVNPIFTLQYAVAAAPAIVVAVVLGIDAAGRAWPGARLPLTTALTFGVATVGLTSLVLAPSARDPAGLDVMAPGYAGDEDLPAQELVDTNRALAKLSGRAVVLFRYTPGTTSPHVEPVYNADVAWPDDARVVRAHDRGPAANAELLRYYAARQPDRAAYLVDRAKYRQGGVDAAITSLGPVGVAVRQFEAGPR